MSSCGIIFPPSHGRDTRRAEGFGQITFFLKPCIKALHILQISNLMAYCIFPGSCKARFECAGSVQKMQCEKQRLPVFRDILAQADGPMAWYGLDGIGGNNGFRCPIFQTLLGGMKHVWNGVMRKRAHKVIRRGRVECYGAAHHGGKDGQGVRLVAHPQGCQKTQGCDRVGRILCPFQTHFPGCARIEECGRAHVLILVLGEPADEPVLVILIPRVRRLHLTSMPMKHSVAGEVHLAPLFYDLCFQNVRLSTVA